MQQTLGSLIAGGAFAVPAPRRKILVASSHGILRHGLKLMLRAATPHQLVDDDRPLEEIGAMLAMHRPDIVIADLTTDSQGLAAVRAAFADAAAGAQLVVLCPSRGLEGCDVPAAALVTAADDALELLRAVRQLADSGACGIPRARPAAPPAAAPADAAPARDDGMHVTPREREVIELITQGLCSKRIARALNISVTTVRTHRQRVMTKLGLRNSVEVAQFAARAFGSAPAPAPAPMPAGAAAVELRMGIAGWVRDNAHPY